MHWVSFKLDLCCVYGVRHFQYWNLSFSADDALYFLKTLCESVNILFQTKLHQSDPKLKTLPNVHRSLLCCYNQHRGMDAGLLLVPCGVRHTQFRC